MVKYPIPSNTIKLREGIFDYQGFPDRMITSPKIFRVYIVYLLLPVSAAFIFLLIMSVIRGIAVISCSISMKCAFMYINLMRIKGYGTGLASWSLYLELEYTYRALGVFFIGGIF